MARTKASVGAKVSSGKSNKARCSVATPSSSTGSGGTDRSSRAGGSGGGNSVCPRETPAWQRAITTFFITKQTENIQDGDEEAAGSSKQKHRRNIIESEEEEEETEETPTNTELDETIELEPLTGDKSHKIEEYYPKNGTKGKGIGKKTKGKENVSSSERNKRTREDTLEESVSKKVKI